MSHKKNSEYPKAIADELDKIDATYNRQTANYKCPLTNRANAGHLVLVRKDGEETFTKLKDRDGKDIHVEGGPEHEWVTKPNPNGTGAQQLLALGVPKGYVEMKIRAGGEWCQWRDARKEVLGRLKGLESLGFETTIASKLKEAIAAKKNEQQAATVEEGQAATPSVGPENNGFMGGLKNLVHR